MFDLKSVHNFLGKHTVIIPDAVSVRRNPQGGDGIQETGGQTPQAAITQARVDFLLDQVFQTVSEFLQAFPTLVLQTQIDQAVGQEPAEQEFEGKVIDTLGPRVIIGSLSLDPASDQMVPDDEGQGFVTAKIIGPVRIGSQAEHQMAPDIILQGFLVRGRAARQVEHGLLRHGPLPWDC